jgi:hypothetical protein
VRRPRGAITIEAARMTANPDAPGHAALTDRIEHVAGLCRLALQQPDLMEAASALAHGGVDERDALELVGIVCEASASRCSYARRLPRCRVCRTCG